MQIKLTYKKHLMQGGFSGAGPTAPTPPLPPAPSQAATNVNSNNLNARPRAGFQSTILTDGVGVPNQTSKKTILGG